MHEGLHYEKKFFAENYKFTELYTHNFLFHQFLLCCKARRKQKGDEFKFL